MTTAQDQTARCQKLLREYCDNCGKEILQSKETITDGDMIYPRDTRITIHVNGSPIPMKEGTNITVDVLCPDCAKKWRYTE